MTARPPIIKSSPSTGSTTVDGERPSSSTTGGRREPDEDEAYHERNTDIVKYCDLCVLDDQRIFYICHSSRSSHWEPPWASWRCRLGLPYGWEQSCDQNGYTYYINHLTKTTTYTDPRQSDAPEGERTVSIARRAEMGFGFVAAGQHPTIIQFVSPDGPSDGLIYANDQILAVNGTDVRDLTKDEVVEMVRSSIDQVEMIVEQIPQRTARSARKNCKVRFTDRVAVASRPESPNDFPPSLPNVLRVYLENGQTRSFKYDNETTVNDILLSLMSKLQYKSRIYFSMAIEYSLGARSSRLSLLRSDTKITTIIALPNSSHFRCVLRFSFIPQVVGSILEEDPKAFEYFYQQCVNDVVMGRFAFEMRYEACVRLAALHMQQVSLESSILKDGRVSLSKLEKEYGLETFLPAILLDNVKRREIRKHLRFYLQKDSTKLAECIEHKEDEAGSSFQTEDVGLMIRLKYLHIVSHLPSFGGRAFSVTFKESQIDMIMQVDPKNGLLVRHPGKGNQPAISIGFDLIGRLVVRYESDLLYVVSIRMANNTNQGLEFTVERDDLDDLLSYLAGYHEVQQGEKLPIAVDTRPPTPPNPPTTPPPYMAIHNTVPAGWNYTSEVSNKDKKVDLSNGPPRYEVANKFQEVVVETANGQKTIVKKACEIRRNSETKPLLRATDSLLTKNCRQLQKKDTPSPVLPRLCSLQRNGVEGASNGISSDTSDTEDSSWSSPIRSPINSMRHSSDLSVLLECPVESRGRRESIETLMQKSINNQQTTLEDLILSYPGCNSSEMISQDEYTSTINAAETNGHLKKDVRTIFDKISLIDQEQ